jgi:hypothetical protein
MTREKFEALGITAQCRKPEPVACYERQNSHEQSHDDACPCCPVASWITAMVLSDSAVEELPISGQWLESSAPERIGEGIASVQETTFGLKAA